MPWVACWGQLGRDHRVRRDGAEPVAARIAGHRNGDAAALHRIVLEARQLVGVATPQRPVQLDVGEQEHGRVVLAFERQLQGLSHRAATAIAADQPGGLDGLGRAVGMPERGRDRVIAVAERDQLGAALDPAAERGGGRPGQPGAGRIEMR